MYIDGHVLSMYLLTDGAKMRHDACINRENVAMEWMMERYVDEEYKDERVKEVINHYRKTHSL